MMTTLRFIMFAATAVLLSGLAGALASDLQPSTQRVMVAAITALIAPLFWPGASRTPARTALRIGAWSCAAACLAAAMMLFGHPDQAVARVFATSAMLVPIMLLVHALAAVLETCIRNRSADAETAREIAGRIAAITLAFLGSLPVWLGPTAQLLTRGHAGIIDLVVGASPLTHLAVASGNDLLRNQWFYQHSNLAALQFSYPEWPQLAAMYATICLALALATLVPRPLPHRAAPGSESFYPTTEHAK
jgi:hypothetical protein